MIRVISFDVGETLLRPYPRFGERLVQCCRESGQQLPIDAEKHLETFASTYFSTLRRSGSTYSRSEDESRRAWLGLYQSFLAHQGVPRSVIPSLAERLYGTFTDPSTYRLFDDAWPVLTELRDRGFSIGVISNWEGWLTKLLEACGVARLLDFSAISGVVGYEKPDPRIFHWAIDAALVAPSEILHVGDSPRDDVAGARQVGLEAVLLDRHGRHVDAEVRRVVSLRELLDFPELSGLQEAN